MAPNGPGLSFIFLSPLPGRAFWTLGLRAHAPMVERSRDGNFTAHRRAGRPLGRLGSLCRS